MMKTAEHPHSNLVTSKEEESMGIYHTYSLGYHSVVSRREPNNLKYVQGGNREQIKKKDRSYVVS